MNIKPCNKFTSFLFTQAHTDQCGSSYYQTQQETCSNCGGIKYIHPKNTAYSCCSTTVSYNPKIENCCDNEIDRLEDSTKNAENSLCCGRRAYFPDAKFCCPGMNIVRFMEDNTLFTFYKLSL